MEEQLSGRRRSRGRRGGDSDRDVNKDLTPKDQDKDKDLTPKAEHVLRKIHHCTFGTKIPRRPFLGFYPSKFDFTSQKF